MSSKLAFYSAYHRNETNKAIHFVFVPALVLYVPPCARLAVRPRTYGHVTMGMGLADEKTSSGLILMEHLRLPNASSQILAPGLATQWSAGLVSIIGYCAYYIYLDPVGGVSYY